MSYINLVLKTILIWLFLCYEVCRFNFEDIYGDTFKNKIHIHHKKPIREIGSHYILNTKEDLIPVCPNCHMVIHSRKPAYSTDEVKDFIRNRQNSI